MGAKQSADMVKARHLVTVDGLTPYAAAAKVGTITRQAIYMSEWYKRWKNDKR